MSHDSTDETDVALGIELRALIHESKEFALPESVDYAINDRRFWDVPKRLREACDTATRRLKEEQAASPPDEQIDTRDFGEYVWLHELLIKWSLLDEKYVTSGIAFAVPR